MTSNATRLRAQFASGDMVIAPGAYDGITARLVEQAGFPAIYMTGAGTAATIGFPDYGLVTMSEMAENAERITRAVKVPVIADADTGYGNELNVVRTVREYERRGVAALHLEDQGFPKRCGHLDDKEIVPREDWLAKIRAAASARTNPDFTIIARTDARAKMGFDEAVTRANLALAAGADMAFVEAPQTMEEVANVPKLVRGPCLLNVVYGGKTPEIDLRDAQKMGYRLAIVPGLLFKTVMASCDDALAALKKEHRHPVPGRPMTVQQAFARVGANDWDPMRTAFREPTAKAAE
ncbi:MAG: isocitrate lyase/PEP mutase family protein [Proteobacteria bacterium]|nr:isocitrate lyase/PEP mutase family protein [Pseudomonadota bacterium]